MGDILFLAVPLIIAAFFIYVGWRIFEKANQPGWAAIVPIYNLVVTLQIVGRPMWWIILFIIPVVNFIMAAVISIDLAKSFGKSTGFGLGLWLLGFIFGPILAFGDAQYQGPCAANESATATA